jgi:hypothetical protein
MMAFAVPNRRSVLSHTARWPRRCRRSAGCSRARCRLARRCSRQRCRSGRRRGRRRWRLDLKDRRLLSVDGNTQSTHFFLDRRQDRYDSGEGVLILRHQTPYVFDIGACPVVVAGVRLDVLQTYVEYPQSPLDRIQLRYRQQLDLGCGTGRTGWGLRSHRTDSRRRGRGGASLTGGCPDRHPPSQATGSRRRSQLTSGDRRRRYGIRCCNSRVCIRYCLILTIIGGVCD